MTDPAAVNPAKPYAGFIPCPRCGCATAGIRSAVVIQGGMSTEVHRQRVVSFDGPQPEIRDGHAVQSYCVCEHGHMFTVSVQTLGRQLVLAVQDLRLSIDEHRPGSGSLAEFELKRTE